MNDLYLQIHSHQLSLKSINLMMDTNYSKYVQDYLNLCDQYLQTCTLEEGVKVRLGILQVGQFIYQNTFSEKNELLDLFTKYFTSTQIIN